MTCKWRHELQLCLVYKRYVTFNNFNQLSTNSFQQTAEFQQTADSVLWVSFPFESSFVRLLNQLDHLAFSHFCFQIMLFILKRNYIKMSDVVHWSVVPLTLFEYLWCVVSSNIYFQSTADFYSEYQIFDLIIIFIILRWTWSSKLLK